MVLLGIFSLKVWAVTINNSLSEAIGKLTQNNQPNRENLKKVVNLVNLDVLEAILIEIIAFEILLVAK